MSILEDLNNLRRDYEKGEFSEKSANPNPFIQFDLWFKDAEKENYLEPNAMTLSTVSKDLKPSSRVVLLKNYDERGFVFFTNYDSKKGRELAANPAACIIFYWDKLERQIRIEGDVIKTTYEESDNYFQTRSYTSRLGAIASKQSEFLKSRFSLLKDVAKLIAKYPTHVPLPDYWGGYRLVPNYFEFWQGRPSRLHDRICYTKDGNVWIMKRLYP